jgi:hypothetical protein
LTAAPARVAQRRDNVPASNEKAYIILWCLKVMQQNFSFFFKLILLKLISYYY